LRSDHPNLASAYGLYAAYDFVSSFIAKQTGFGRDILERQAQQGWGVRVIKRLAHDLRTSFP
jgi:hypothetical protein